MEQVIIGDATLYLADCMDILPTLPKVDAVITDPPYGINVTSKRRNGEVESWDAEAPNELVKQAIELGGISVVFGGNYFDLPPAKCWLVWDKMISDGLSLAHAELAWTNIDRAVRVKRHLWSGPFREGNEQRNGHPTQKPIDVMRWAIEQCKPSPQTILDPFMGSGTTGVAAIQLGRSFIGIEREERYFQIACERISNAVAQGQLFAPEQPKQIQESLL